MSKASEIWGEFSLGSRLRLITEQLYGDVDRYYAEHNVPFKTRYYPVFHLLNTQGPQTIKLLAERAGFSHSAMSQTIKAMSESNYVKQSLGTDARERIIELTSDGQELLKTLQPHWKTIEAVKEHIFAECTTHFMQALEQLETALENKGLYERLQDTTTDRK